jgi:hypothetical protein
MAALAFCDRRRVQQDREIAAVGGQRQENRRPCRLALAVQFDGA